MSQATFPSSGHDHAVCTRRLLARAEEVCRHAGARLTTLRRSVLASVAESHQASGAYDIIERLATSGPRPAPISVYRALAFLVAHGLVHKIESRNAFVACTHGRHASDAVMVICEDCGVVAEMDAGDALSDLVSRAGRMGFETTAAVVEVKGCCRECRNDG
jgi:Fur family zinc uptake transcriptional regulator